MARQTEIKEEVVATPVEVVVPVVVKEDSEAKKAFRKLIAIYAEQNPLKFADKKEALFAKLETL
jgi:hypothetical protein